MSESPAANCARIARVSDHMAATGDRLIVTRHGQPVAAIVSMGDVHSLEAEEEGRGDG